MDCKVQVMKRVLWIHFKLALKLRISLNISKKFLVKYLSSSILLGIQYIATNLRMYIVYHP